MRLLIITQKIDENDGVLGFMHDWIAGFAEQLESVIAVGLSVGEQHLPSNVKVLSLGKESGASKIKYLWNFFKYIYQERNNYDEVFVHMNQIYILLGGLVWKMMGKKVSLWYAHGATPTSLKIAEYFTDIIFTSTKSGCRLSSKKIKVVGQGINVNRFLLSEERFTNKDRPFRIVTVGRISPVKDYETLINATNEIYLIYKNIEVIIVGGVGIMEQKEYLDRMQGLVTSKSIDHIVSFKGSISNKEILPYLYNADLFVNTSLTGSLDKAMLEAMATGLPVFTCNESMLEVLGDLKYRMMFNKRDYVELSEKILEFLELNTEVRQELGTLLRDIVVKDHSLKAFVKKIIDNLNTYH
ncbi:MAG: glycosyltransferase family 4 protein [Candidatus Paceibacterota bacterium]